MPGLIYPKAIFDSDAEWKFYEWLLEADDYVSYYKFHPDKIHIFDKVTVERTIHKGKSKLTKKNVGLLREMTYTPDFEVIFTKKILDFPLNIFDVKGVHLSTYKRWDIDFPKDGIKVLIDIKSKAGNRFGNNSSAIAFPIKQKVLWHNKKIYVEKIIVETFLRKTWCPVRLAYMQNRKQLTLTKLGMVCKLLEDIDGKDKVQIQKT